MPPFRVGDEVEARWNYQEGGLTWYLGRIAAVHRDGSCDVAYDDRDFEERVAPNLIRTQFNVETLGNACDLSVGARCFALFDDPENYGGQDVWGGTILNAWTQRGGLSHGRKRLRVVFDDGSIHSPWASEVARAVTPSIARSMLRIDRPGHKARRLIARARCSSAPSSSEPAVRGSRTGCLKTACSRGPSTLILIVMLTTSVDFLELPLDYLIGNKIIHASMDCFTFSFLAGTKHRTRQNPEGHSPEAARANREFAHLRAMCERAKAADPNVLLSFENPVGMMELTEGAREGLEKGLGLTKLEVSYCKFAFGAGSPYVKKPTHFWTNSPLLIANFGDGKFTCSKYGAAAATATTAACGRKRARAIARATTRRSRTSSRVSTRGFLSPTPARAVAVEDYFGIVRRMCGIILPIQESPAAPDVFLRPPLRPASEDERDHQPPREDLLHL